MRMVSACRQFMCLLTASIILPVNAQTLTIAISSADTLPLAKIEHEKLRGGILKDIGDAIGAYHQRTVVYITPPRRSTRPSV